MSIQPLPPDVIAQIKSSTTITSLNGVVIELVKNSLDAGATKVDITVDYGRGGCIVEDNGLGILPSEFKEGGCLGKQYHSSKFNSQTPTHGGHGTFLASVSALSLLSIVSHHQAHRYHNSISLHKSDIIARQTPAPAQQHLSYSEHGTRVTVRDLFGSMPVRVKQRAAISESQGSNKLWKVLWKEMVMLLLAWPGAVSVVVREAGSSNKMVVREHSSEKSSDSRVDIAKVCSILSQASYITPAESSSWVAVSATTSKLTLGGAISLQPSPTKQVQFLAFSVQPIVSEGQNVLSEEINRLFINSAFGNEEELDELDDAERNRRALDRRYKSDGYTGKELKGTGKGVDRWPMFYINIQQMGVRSPTNGLDVDDVLNDKGNTLSAIIDLLQVMIREFLTRHHFRPKATSRHRSKDTRGASKKASTSREPSQDFPTSISATRPQNGSKTEIARNARFDLMGNNIRLPSFHRSTSNVESAFNSWSRIKSAATSSSRFEAIGKVLEREGTVPDTSTSSFTQAEKSVAPNDRPRSSTPLISKSGKLIRRPFEDVFPIPRSQSAPPKETLSSKESDISNKLVAWINPVTKVRSLVDTRTGHVIPETRKVALCSSTRLTSKKASTPTPRPESPSPWIDSVLKTWENPIFRPTELEIPQVSYYGDSDAQKILHGQHHHCSQLDIDRAFKQSSAGINGRISKDALREAKVISQVDKKFVLVKVKAKTNYDALGQTSSDLLVLIDQHAADERIRIEALMAGLCQPPASNNSGLQILATHLEKPLVFEVPPKEIDLFRKHALHFAKWGILIDIPPSPLPKSIAFPATQKIAIRTLPPGIATRCSSSPKLLISLLRTEIHTHDESPYPSHPSLPSLPPTHDPSSRSSSWLHKIHTCPQGIIDMLNSRACRSAIMFNDSLSKAQCEVLVRKLADCMFPFQCAHGRPSLVPLVDLGGVGNRGGVWSRMDNEKKDEGKGGLWEGLRRLRGELEKGK